MISINPTKKISEEQKALMKKFFQQNPDIKYVDKNKPYIVKGDPDTEIQFSNPLIRSKENEKQYYVIETTRDMEARKMPKEDIEQRKGSYSNVRTIVASINLNTDGDLSQKREKGKVVRVKNRSKARHPNYTHASAVDDYNKMRDFPHLAPEPPVEVNKQDNYTKSYTVMNELQGAPLNVAAREYSGYADTKILLDCLIIPIFESYQEQVAKQGKVHCDIKPPNILALLPENILEEKAEIKFLDFDFSEDVGVTDKHRGTPCYMPPFDPKIETKLTSARDMFALAMIAVELINPDLGSIDITYSSMARSSDSNNSNDKTWHDTFSSIIADGGNYYNLTHIINQKYAGILSQSPDTPIAELFYNYCEQVSPQQPHLDLMRLLESMAHADPEKAPTLESVIEQLHQISSEIIVEYELESQVDETPLSSSLDIAKSLSMNPKAVLKDTTNTNEKLEASAALQTKTAPVSSEEPAKENSSTINTSRMPTPRV